MSPSQLTPEQRAARIQEWQAAVTAAMNDAQKWSEQEGWPVRREEKTAHEEMLGDYVVPLLHIRVSEGELLVKPVGLHVIGADGRIDLEGWPSLNRVKLIRREGRWQLFTDSNVPFRRDWTRETFSELAKDLVAAS